MVAGDKTADGGQGLAEGPHDKVDLVGLAEVGRGPPAVGAQHSQAVGIVEINQQVRKGFLQGNQFRQGAHVPGHAEHAFGDEDHGPVAVFLAGRGDPLGGSLGVVVGEGDNLGLGGLAAFENAGMVLTVGTG